MDQKRFKVAVVIIVVVLAVVIIGVVAVNTYGRFSYRGESISKKDAGESEAAGNQVSENDPVNESDTFPYTNEEGYIVFGVYEQDGDESNGPEPIEWEVLDSDENGTLLVSRYVLDLQSYNLLYEDMTWETSYLRQWLNSEFLDRAFTANEQSLIRITKLSNPDNAKEGTEGGNSTQDRVFCLSMEEILAYYDFNIWDDERQFGYSEQLIIPATPYAQQRGVDIDTLSQQEYDDWNFAEKNYSEDVIGRVGAWWYLESASMDIPDGELTT